MPNPYIQNYENYKNSTLDYLTSAITVIGKLKADREKWGFRQTKDQGMGYGWRGDILQGLKLFYHKETTAKNVQVITDILMRLVELKNNRNNQEFDKFVRDKMISILRERNYELSIGDTRKLMEYIILDISKIDYNHRPSSLIQPDAQEVILHTDAAEQPYLSNQQWKTQLTDLLARKQLSPDLFSKEDAIFRLALEDDISVHVAWAFKHIYSIPYPKSHSVSSETKNHGSIARHIHGIQHVSRVALYILIFANLYRKYGDHEAIQLTSDNIKLLQIAAVFHDSAREDEGVDQWDHESAIFLYCYLTRLLGVDRATAKLMAEAIANKDVNASGYFVIDETPKDGIYWALESSQPTKNIYQRLIHDADCLDIIRARVNFDGQHLDFYKKFGTNSFAFEELAYFIAEARNLIEIHGDSCNRIKIDIKKQYEHDNVYQATLQMIGEKKYTILALLGNQLLELVTLQVMQLVDTTSYDPNAGLTEKNVRAAMWEGKIFARGIGAPSAWSEKPLKSGKDESLASTEIRKTKRRKGIPTTSSKMNRLEKEGNPLRSVSIFGHGVAPFADAGFIIISPNIDDISKIYMTDADTGRGKKKWLKDAKHIIPRLNRKDKKKQLTELHQRLKLGGSTLTFSNMERVSGHVEILYHIREFSAVYFSNDPNSYNTEVYKTPEASHLCSPILQAIFLRNEYKKVDIQNAELPIFEYSSLHNTLRRIPQEELTDNCIKEMWLSMCSDYIKQRLVDFDDNKIYRMSVDDIKTLSMYRVMDNDYAKKHAPADTNYDQTLRKEISDAIEKEKQKLIREQEETVLKKTTDNQLSVFSDEPFFNLMRNPVLANHIIETIQREMKSHTFDITSIKDFLYSPGFQHSIFDLLPVEKDSLLEQNELARKVFYETKTMRMYILAKILGLGDFVEAIKIAMTQIAVNKKEEISHQLSEDNKKIFYCFNRDTYVNLIDIINFSISFDIYSGNNEIKRQMDQLVDQYFCTFSQRFSDHLQQNDYRKIIDYCLFLDYLCSVNLLNVNQMQRARDIMDDIKQKITDSASNDRVLTSYLTTCKKLYSDQLGYQRFQKEIVLGWFKSHCYWITDDTMYILYQLKTLGFDDPDIFQEMVNHIAMNVSPILCGTDKIDMGYWAKMVLEFEKLMPSKEFTQKQLDILKIKSEALFLQLLSNLVNLSDNNACLKLASNIYSFLILNIPIKLPDLIILEIKRCLVTFSSMQNVSARERGFIEYIRDRLPAWDQRQNLENQLSIPIPLFSLRANN
ncbi:MAG TPA: SidE phosphodiesterase domain-containing protein [Gammaproteobacteria bacterium]|nr:SidE phosphodiesterase domain-containing protein [Gammaproteobacteria bacterium]